MSYAKITYVTPDNPEEERSLAKAVMSVAAVLKGKSTSAVLDDGLYDYVSTLPAAATYVTKRTKTGLIIPGASAATLRVVGGVLVAVEVPRARDGIFLSLFTDKVEKKR